jgi:DNA repair exonuclease SbcCD ATPase subunit
MGNKYVYSRHNAPITVNARDRKGAVLFTKTFQPERLDAMTGRVVSTGYTTLTDEEYKQLSESSKTFTHYRDKLKLLSVSDDVPPEAKSPHEALADARRETRAANSKAAEQAGEIEKLKARVLEAEDKYKQLVSASLDEEKLKAFNDKIASLEDSLKRAADERDAAINELKAVKDVLPKKAAGKGGKDKEFD